MKITSIKALNVKGLHFAEDLGPVTIFVGQHRAGKTARLDAIRLALLGYVPLIGKTNAATFTLSSRDTMSVYLDADCGHIRRVWKRKGKETIEQVKQIDATIPETPEILLDSRAFFAMTPAAKTKWAFEHAKLDTTRFSPAGLVARVKNIAIEGHTVEHEHLLEGFVDELTNSARSLGDAEITLQEWLTAEALVYADKIDNAKRQVDRMEKLVAGMTQLESGEAVAAKVSDAEKSLKKTMAEFNEAQGLLGSWKQKVADAMKARDGLGALEAQLPKGNEEGQLKEIESQLKHLESVRHESTVATAEEAFLKADLLRHDARVARGKVESAIGMVNLQFDHEMARQRKRISIAEEIKKIDAKHPLLNEEILGAQQVINDVTNQMEADGERCQACGQPLPAHAALALRREALKMELFALQLTLRERQSMAEELNVLGESKITKLNEERVVLEERLSTFDLRALEDDVQKAVEKLNEAKQRDETNSARLGLIDSRRQLHARISVIVTNASLVREKIARIPSTETLAGLMNETDAVRATVAKLAEKIDFQQAEVNAARAAHQDHLRKLQAIKERELAMVHLEVSKAVLGEIRGYQLEVLDGCFAPFLETANRIAHPMLGLPLVIEDGELGYHGYHGDHFVPFKVFSGLEQAITTMAVCLALGDGAPCRIVLMDEMRAINDETKTRLIPLLLELVKSRVIDQFVGTDTDDQVYNLFLGPELTVIKI